ncbi:origin recognition complex subunit 2 [Caerostris darwini]|uniref:Origin recognition complex subunit 2 n=1 Tax=Caerostris darwini TaxID=1538125 RepID=A0AAV4PFC1_9ARAC|nr:origin recognition complex subunit 2 [Caerostris darwini]
MGKTKFTHLKSPGKRIPLSNENVSNKTLASPKTPNRISKLQKNQGSVSTGKLSQQLFKFNLDSPKTPQFNSKPEETKHEPDSSKKEVKQLFNDGNSTNVEVSERRVSMRQRMKNELANLKNSNLESDPEDSDEDVSGDELDCALPSVPDKKNPIVSFSEAYFSAQKQKKVATSNRTLSTLKLERTNIEELQKILKSVPDQHKKEKENMFQQYQRQFKKWKFLLHEGFNILLYGVGSKQNVLNSFCKECLSEELYVNIHGFFPNLTIKQVLSSITEDAMEYDGKFPSNYEHAEYIKRHFSEGSAELFLIFHNLDGMPLRNTKTQTLLSSLAAIPNIHFVASIDHINAPLLWDQIMLNNYKWVWFDVTTFEPYVLETSYEDSIFKDKSSHLLLSSLLNVYNGLNKNGQGVFKILAKHQFEEKDNSFLGIAFHEWYQECREAFLVTSEVTMQAQLSEFKNHKLLTSRKSFEGCELWYIPVDRVTLEQFLENCK